MSEADTPAADSPEALQLTAEIVASYVTNNTIPVDALPDFIRSVYAALQNLNAPVEDKPAERLRPAVAVSKSVTDDYIICLEDGAKLKMLKRYLRTNFNMSPEDYRKRWNLPADYPMVAPSYAKRRSDFAIKIGLGRGVRRSRRDRETAAPKGRKS